MQGQLDEMRAASHDTKDAIAQAKRLADAAAKQAEIAKKTLVGLERPYVFVEFEPVDLTQWLNDYFVPDPVFKMNLTNYGRVPGIVNKVECAPIITNTVSMMHDMNSAASFDISFLDSNAYISFIKILDEIKSKVINASNTLGNINCLRSLWPTFPMKEAHEFHDKLWRHDAYHNGQIWVIGRIWYESVFGDPYLTTFCLQYSFGWLREAGNASCNKRA